MVYVGSISATGIYKEKIVETNEKEDWISTVNRRDCASNGKIKNKLLLSTLKWFCTVCRRRREGSYIMVSVVTKKNSSFCGVILISLNFKCLSSSLLAYSPFEKMPPAYTHLVTPLRPPRF